MIEKKLNTLNKSHKLTMITAYDYVSGYVVNKSDAEMILVGDSLGNTTLGYNYTSSVTIEDIIRATEAISRANITKILVADLPYQTYESKNQALENAKKLISSGADAVKLEGGKEKSEIIRCLVDNKISVMGHIGIQPQSISDFSQYKVLGKNSDEEDKIIVDSNSVEKSGAFSIVLELVDKFLAKKITGQLSIPTIGIGSGDFTDGQVQVFNDLIGYSPNKIPKHAKKYDNLFEKAQQSIDSFVNDTRNL
ncbi:MAG: 3-methyl-2-oxobutanoate hydroxymethyltransferase [Chloroflexi bacterium]|nr:3-methyl-2-oxobutanoate hydroxymethyltransferase [Chloroflexota bacterium]